MDVLIKTVNKNVVNFQDEFKYTINMSFNGIVGEINNAKIVEFFPSYISYKLPSSIPYVKNIIEESIEGGTRVTFDFGSITNLGIAITINITCKFILGTESNTSFNNTCEMYINNELYTSTASSQVTLSVSEDFIIEKDIAVPNNKVGSPGGRVIFAIYLKNKLKSQGGNGDPGAKISNIKITDVIPPGLSLDTNYPVSGRDVSPSNFADKRYDNQMATIEENNMIFEIPDYYGTSYRIICVCNVDLEITLSEVTNTVNLEINDIYRDGDSVSLIIGDPLYSANITKAGPNSGSVGNLVSFELSTGNYGNRDMLNFTIEDKIPDEITPYRINTGSFQLNVLFIPTPQPYNIEYSINNSENYNLLGTYNTAVSRFVTLPNLGQGEKITKIRWVIPNMAVGIISNRKIAIDGIISSIPPNNEFTNIGEITYRDNTGVNIIQATHKTNLNDKSELNLNKTKITNKTSFIPKDTIRYALKFNGNNSQINNPVVSDLLSNKLQYIGNEKYIFYDYFNNLTIDSTNPNFNNLVPIKKDVDYNYKNTNQTLVTYNMDNFSLRQRGQFTIEFDAKVKVGAIGSIENFGIIGNKGNNAVVAAGQISYLDTDDRDKDNITSEAIVKSNTNISQILYANALSSDKKVKGALDTEYTEEPNVGLTYEGGDINYKLIISNAGNLPYSYIQIVDILPHIDDTGVILTNENRLSQFPIYLKGNVFAYIVENDVILSNIDMKIEYSQSYNPVRFGGTNFGDDIIGVDNDWATTPPSNITAIKSIRITIDNYLLQPNQSIVIDLQGIAPVGVSENQVAWNSMAVKARFLDEYNEEQKILPVEPEKVGIKIKKTDNGSISGRTWHDENKNGNIEIDEPMLNGIIVRLLSENMSLIEETVTTSDLNNNKGYYMFNNLNMGDYIVQFIPPKNYYFTIDDANVQNKADSVTGLTHKYTVNTANLNIEDIDGGFIEGIDLIILIVDFLHDNIYSLNCDFNNGITPQVQYNNKKLANIIDLVIEYFTTLLYSPEIDDEGFKAQIQRLIESLKTTSRYLKAINIPSDYCNRDFISHMIINQVYIIIALIELLQLNRGLINESNDCLCLKINVFNILIVDFIGNITDLESINIDLYKLLYALNMDTKQVMDNYMATYSPKTRIITKPIIQNTAHFCAPRQPCKNIRKH